MNRASQIIQGSSGSQPSRQPTEGWKGPGLTSNPAPRIIMRGVVRGFKIRPVPQVSALAA